MHARYILIHSIKSKKSAFREPQSWHQQASTISPNIPHLPTPHPPPPILLPPLPSSHPSIPLPPLPILIPPLPTPSHYHTPSVKPLNTSLYAYIYHIFYHLPIRLSKKYRGGMHGDAGTCEIDIE